MNTHLLLTVAAVVLGMPFSTSAQEKPSAFANRLVGTWVLVGTPGAINEIPAKGGRLKLITSTHWVVTQSNPQSGVVIFHHGGTYTLNGDEYVENVEFANENTSSLISKSHTFKIKIDGDTLTQTGTGNPWTEVWKRLK